jgi:hypothetical protein
MHLDRLVANSKEEDANNNNTVIEPRLLNSRQALWLKHMSLDSSCPQKGRSLAGLSTLHQTSVSSRDPSECALHCR